MVGQSLLPGTPPLNIIYTDRDGSKLYLYRQEDEHYLILDLTSPVTRKRLHKFREIFTAIILGLIERGLDHVNTWVMNNEADMNLAYFFGFEETGYVRALRTVDDEEPVIVREMIYVFPELDNEENA